MNVLSFVLGVTVGLLVGLRTGKVIATIAAHGVLTYMQKEGYALPTKDEVKECTKQAAHKYFERK